MSEGRRVVLAIDGSEHSHRAFECEYLNTSKVHFCTGIVA